MKRRIILALTAVAVALSPVTTPIASAAPSTEATVATAQVSADAVAPTNEDTATQAGEDAVEPMIVGGAVPKRPYSFAGSLQVKDKDPLTAHRCGLTLVTPPLGEYGQWAQTNAHCVDNLPPHLQGDHARPTNAAQAWYAWWFRTYRLDNASADVPDQRDPSLYTTRFGSVNRLEGGVVRGLSKIKLHERWDWGIPDPDGYINDMAMVQLSGDPVWLSPARIVPANSNKLVRQIGWGLATQVPPAVPTVLMNQIDVALLDSAECAGAFIGTGELCTSATGSGGGPCDGDSGTAEMQKLGREWVAIGSASRGVNELVCGSAPSVYTDLWAFRPWMIRAVFDLPETASTAGRDLMRSPR